MVVPGSIPNMMRSFANFNSLFCPMIRVSHKAKQYWFALAKVLVLAGAFYFIWLQLADNDKLDWQQFLEKLRYWSWPSIAFIILLSAANRFLEILKWQNLVSVIEPISVGTATKQVLGAFTASLFTPNGIGEYGAKTLFFEKSFAKKIVFLNLVCNGIQMALSIVFGILGLLYFNLHFHIITLRTALLLIIVSCLLIIGSFLVKKIAVKGYSLEKIVRKIKLLPVPVHRKNTVLAIGRYAVFSHQYFFLFRMFGVELPYLLMMSAITAVYFLASSLPTFQFLDFAVKGSIAVYFFGLLGVNEWITVFISTLMWFLNVVLPVTLGSYYVVKFKSPWSQ